MQVQSDLSVSVENQNATNHNFFNSIVINYTDLGMTLKFVTIDKYNFDTPSVR